MDYNKDNEDYGNNNEFDDENLQNHDVEESVARNTPSEEDLRRENLEQRRREEERERTYVYQGSSSYESGQKSEPKKKKRFSAFALIAVMVIFTFLGTGLGVYGAYNILPGTSLFSNSKLYKNANHLLSPLHTHRCFAWDKSRHFLG